MTEKSADHSKIHPKFHNRLDISADFPLNGCVFECLDAKCFALLFEDCQFQTGLITRLTSLKIKLL